MLTSRPDRPVHLQDGADDVVEGAGRRRLLHVSPAQAHLEGHAVVDLNGANFAKDAKHGVGVRITKS